MFKTENVHLIPNILSKTIEQEEANNRRSTAMFRDTTNNKNRACRINKMNRYKQDLDDLQLQKANTQRTDQQKKIASQIQHENTKKTKLNNLLINFDSQEQSNEQDKKQKEQVKNESAFKLANIPLSQQTLHSNQIKEKISQKMNGFLLEMDFEDEQLPSSNQQHDHQEQKVAEYNKEKQPPQIKKKDFLLKLQIQDEQPSENGQHEFNNSTEREADNNQRVVIRLASMVSRFQNKYYLEAVPEGAVFQCVVKRDRCQSLIKYHLYDCVSLRNFMTIIKDQYGYLAICKEGNKSHNSIPQKQTVVARIVSNFFGTEFNCTLQNIPYTRGYSYPVTQKAENVITIEYETNFFGLKGPRKMSAYIPVQKQHKYQCLNEVYQKQKKKNLKKTVLKFKNKTPRWCKEINAYVLNFRGRASVSSIKNFVLVGQHENEEAQEKVLFGKFGRQLFNLDVRHPFSILQAVAMALSSFDRKLACQ